MAKASVNLGHDAFLAEPDTLVRILTPSSSNPAPATLCESSFHPRSSFWRSQNLSISLGI
jgi:hypothetical protein